ncbi:MAG: Na+/H+ antiporter NhaC family protein [Clostridia bacterium]|nr:Na+/H+ antiporter NhaC family protein [Clostridia bacterium]
MLKGKNFFNKKLITILISSIVVLTLLVVITATGAVHNEVSCPHTLGTTTISHDCLTCGGIGKIICPDCEDLIDTSGCETCGGTELVSCPECDGAKTLNYHVVLCGCDEKCPLCANLENPDPTCLLCGGTGKGEGFVPCSHCAELDAPDTNCALCLGTGYVDCTDHQRFVDIHGVEVRVLLDDTATIVLCETCEGSGIVQGSIWALLPPLIAICLALITKEVFSSLFIGILSGAILVTDFAPLKTVDTLMGTGLIDALAGTAGIFIFLIELGFLVALVNKAGGSAAFGNWAQKHIKTKVGAAICTFILGILIFIDDYFNCLTVGSVMRPVTDKHKISRSKLAYLIDATAAPICMIAPISSWAAAVSQYAADGQGITLFIAAIPFNFYSLLTLVFVLCIILLKFDFGPMKKHEINAENGDLFSGKKISQQQTEANPKGRVFDLIVPIAVLIVVSIFALIYNGGILDGASFIDAFADTDATVALPWAGLITIVFTIIYLAIRKVVTMADSIKLLPQGFIAMVPAMLILTFATALKNITGELGAAAYIHSLMANVPETLAKLLPAIIFIVACILAFATGTSWGTFGILIPIVLAMFATNPELCTIGISACLAGAVCGDHCSPISDTTIMSSAGAECEHLNHVVTQLPYAIYVAAVSFVCFIIAGFITIWYLMLPIAIAIMLGCIFVTKFITNKKTPAETKTQE